MFTFAAIIFCILFVFSIFTLILLIILQIFQIKKYQKFIFNPASIFLISVMTFFTSLWIYTQTDLILSGNITQLQNNISIIFFQDSQPKQASKKQINEFLDEKSNQRNNQLQRGGLTISKYADCLKLYRNNNPEINKSETMFFVRELKNIV